MGTTGQRPNLRHLSRGCLTFYDAFEDESPGVPAQSARLKLGFERAGETRGPEVVAFEPNRREVLRGVVGPMEPMLTYVFEPADGGTRFTRRIQIKISGIMRVMEPLMRLMTPKRNAGFVANLKRVLEEQTLRP